MKKLICTALASLMLLSAVSCGRAVPNITVTSTASAAEQILIDRLGEVPENVVLGDSAVAAEYGIDMTNFEDDGYIIRTVGDETLIFGKTDDGLDRAVRAYAKAVEGGYADTLDVTYHEGYRIKRLTIAGRDISEYSIYLFEGADQCHTIAASELQEYISLACGITLPIVNAPAEHNIVLERVGLDDPRSETLGDEGFTISVKDNGDLYISGGRYRGCLFGVFEFLEKYVGWRFLYDFYNMESYTSDYSRGCIDYLYEAEHVDVPAGISDTQTPEVASRRTVKTVTDHGVYGYRVKDNYHLGGNSGAGTEGKFLEKFNAYGIKRVAMHGLKDGPYRDFVDYDSSLFSQPCFTNEENIEISIYYYVDYINTCIEAGIKVNEIDVSQHDSGRFCMCTECVKYVVSEGGNVGPVLYFTNRIAEAVAEIDPEIYVHMLAYWGTNSVPKTMKPLDNVCVSYCFYLDLESRVCSSHAIDGEECKLSPNEDYTNTQYAEEFRGWCEISNHIAVWYYPGNNSYTAVSSPLLEKTYYDMQYLLSFDNVEIIFTCPAGYNNIMGYYRPEEMFMPYVLARLSWKNCTYEEYLAIVEEYFRIICGDGVTEIMEYLTILEKSKTPGCWNTINLSDDDPLSYRVSYIFFEKNFDTMISLYDRAISKANNEWQEEYIENMSLTMYFTGLCATYESWYKNGTDELRAKYTDIYEHFKELALKHRFFMHGISEDKVYLTEEHFNIEESLEILVRLGNTITN